MQPLIAVNWKMHGTAAREVQAVPEVGGALVGGASLEAADFEAIVNAVPAHA
jgi:triosephosphate isomerase